MVKKLLVRYWLFFFVMCWFCWFKVIYHFIDLEHVQKIWYKILKRERYLFTQVSILSKSRFFQLGVGCKWLIRVCFGAYCIHIQSKGKYLLLTKIQLIKRGKFGLMQFEHGQLRIQNFYQSNNCLSLSSITSKLSERERTLTVIFHEAPTRKATTTT